METISSKGLGQWMRFPVRPRGVLHTLAAWIILLLAAPAVAAPVHLQTDNMASPIGIDTLRPAFSWQSNATTPNWRQTAYEVTVGTKNKGFSTDAWDSGRIVSGDSLNIVYGGRPLKSQTRYFWQVKVWDDKGVSSISTPSWFETGMLSSSDWRGQWILRSDPKAAEELAAVRWLWVPGQDAQKVPSATEAQFRYTLHLDEEPMRASLHIVAGGSFVATVNGIETGHHKSGWSAFDWEEIGPLLKHGHGVDGDNEIVVKVVSPSPRAPATMMPAAFAASLRLTAKDGTERRLVTDRSWTARSSQGNWLPAQEIGPLSMPMSIAMDRNTSAPGPTRIATNANLFRKEFSVATQVRSARLTVAALGAYCASLNGNPVSPKAILTPGSSDFEKRVFYQIYDVTSLVRLGKNAMGITLGGGWHGSPVTWAGTRVYPGPDSFRAQLEIIYSDGTHMTVASDTTWQAAQAPILFSEIYGGEIYDARLQLQHWDMPGFPINGWTNAALSTPPAALTLTAQPDSLIERSNILHPIAMSTPDAAHPPVYDMGQNMVGNVLLHVHGPRGTEVRLRFAERLNPDGSIYTENLREATATDIYVLSGDGDETYTPSFTFHGFRYVEVSGFPGTPSIGSIDGLVYNSLAATPTIRFKSSNPMLNSMQTLGIWGQRGNFFSIPTDCPQRDERLGWMGDAGVFWRTGTYNFDTASFTHKFTMDIGDAQTAEGDFTDVSPDVLQRAYGSPGWADAGVLVPYAAWLQYGDKALLENTWPQMQRFMDFIQQSNPDYLRRNKLGANYGDWLAPDPNTPKDLVGTAYWAIIARDMKEMALALGHPQDAAKYQTLYSHIADAYRTAFVRPDGTVTGDTQTAYVVTLYAGLAPESLRANVTDRLARNIVAHNNHLTTGFLGTPFLMFTLDDNQRSDMAFRLLLQNTYPSWGYMVGKGATTWWERWNGDTGDPGMNSYNHYAFGSVMEWVFRRVAGIDTDSSGTGFHHINVKPHFDAALPQLHTEYDSAYGTITTDWNSDSRRFLVLTPPNTTATVTLPDGRKEDVGSGTHIYQIP